VSLGIRSSQPKALRIKANFEFGTLATTIIITMRIVMAMIIAIIMTMTTTTELV
jgi:hypothetical protein